MAIKESIVEGMRLTHTTHGDGRITSIVDRVSPKTKSVEPYACVSFTAINGTISWSSLINSGKSLPRSTDTSLTLWVAVSDIVDGNNWFLSNDYGDLSDILVDIERLGTKHSAVTPIDFNESISSQIAILGKNLDHADLSPKGDPINILKIVVDWSIERFIRQIGSENRSVATRISELDQWITLIEKEELWSTKLYSSLPGVIRNGTERVLVSVACLISYEHEVEMQDAAKILTCSLEKRIANVHLRALKRAQSRLGARASRMV